MQEKYETLILNLLTPTTKVFFGNVGHFFCR